MPPDTGYTDPNDLLVQTDVKPDSPDRGDVLKNDCRNRILCHLHRHHHQLRRRRVRNRIRRTIFSHGAKLDEGQGHEPDHGGDLQRDRSQLEQFPDANPKLGCQTETSRRDRESRGFVAHVLRQLLPRRPQDDLCQHLSRLARLSRHQQQVDLADRSLWQQLQKARPLYKLNMIFLCLIKGLAFRNCWLKKFVFSKIENWFRPDSN